MTEFGSWGWIELKVTVGEILLALVTALAAYWVAAVIGKHQESARALKDLVAFLCRDSFEHLHNISLLIEEQCPEGRGQFNDATARNKLLRHFLRLSNSMHTIEAAALNSNLQVSLVPAKEAYDYLEQYTLDRVVSNLFLEVRQTEGAILRVREALLSFLIACHRK